MRELIQFERLGKDKSLTSPSGRFVLAYDADADGVAVVTDTGTGQVRWRAGDEGHPVVGRLLLGGDGSLQVEAPGEWEVVWRSDFAVPGARAFGLTDDGDFDLFDGERVRLLNSRTGPVEPVNLGDAAFVADISRDRFIAVERKQRHTVTRDSSGCLQVSTRGDGFGSSYSLTGPLVTWLAERSGTVLTWRVLPYGRRRTRVLCLVDAADNGRRRDRTRPHHDRRGTLTGLGAVGGVRANASKPYADRFRSYCFSTRLGVTRAG